MANYLGRNVNLALLVIIIGVVVALVGTTVFFQRSLQSRTDAFTDTSQTLEQCQVSLANFENKYTQAQQKVNETSADIRKYDTLYDQKVAELKDAQAQMLNLQKQLAFEKLQKEKFQESYEITVRERDQLKVTIANQANKIEDLEDALDACEDDLATCS